MATRERRWIDPEVERMSADELARLQLEGLAELFERSVTANPWFAARCTPGWLERPRSLEDLRRLPLMRKEDVLADVRDRPPFGRRARELQGELRQVVETSGTSGAGRERYPLDDHDHALVLDMERPGFAWAGVGPGTKVASTIPVTTRAGGQWFHDAVRSLGGVWLSLGTYPAEDKLAYLQALGPEVLVASPSYLVRLEIVAEQEGLVVGDLGVRSLMTAGEPYSAAWAREREERWGARLHEQYGSTQRAIAWTCEAGAVPGGELGIMHVLPHLAVYEVLDPDTGEEVDYGETGELVITPFGTSAAPLVRFATGDRVVKLPSGECPCGRAFDGLRCGTIDRYDAMIKVRGINLFPSAVDAVVLADPVTDYQGRVRTDERTGREEIELTIAVGGPDAQEDAAAARLCRELEVRFHRAFGLRATVQLHDDALMTPDTHVDSRKRKRWSDERSARRV